MNRSTRYFVMSLLLINTLLFSGCGSDSGSNQETQATGDIALALVWNTPDAVARTTRDIVLDENDRIDCDASGISTIYVRIYDQASGDFLKDNGSKGWQCSAHSGVVEKVKAGNRKLVCLARDAQDNVIYRGQQLDVAVAAADTTPVQVQMDPFATEPSGLDDDAQITEDTAAFECSAVENAVQYHLQVATDINFTQNLENISSDSTTFDPYQFTTSNTYYWRICALDAHGSQGAWSAPRTMDVTLPPLVSTDPATNVTVAAAVLNGTVNPRGLATTYYFEYGPTTDYGSRTETIDAGENAEAMEVTAQLEGLDTQTTHHFRLVAENSAGPAIGGDQSFETGDGTGPDVRETFPDRNATNMSTTTTIRVRFSEPIKEDTVTASTFIVSDGVSEISGNITCNDDTAKFDPSVPFKTDATYYVTLKMDIQDLAGNRLQSEYTWSFSTRETVPPRVEKTYPLDSARGVQVYPTITATFSEPMDVETLNVDTFLVNDDVEDIEGTVSYDNVSMTATFVPDSNLACDTIYTITVTNKVKDAVGNLMAANKIWQIKTANNCGGEIFTGSHHTIALKTDGTLWAWGSNSNGRLGNGTDEDITTPKQIEPDTDWATVAAGSRHTVALKTNGTLWAWGSNYYGELGDGTSGAQASKWVPTQIGSDTDWAFVAAGGDHTIALKTNGTLWAWGNNYYGELGDGTSGIQASKWVPTQIGNDTDWAFVAAGSDHSVALKMNGTLWAWGYNWYNQLGDGTGEDKNTPTQIGKDTSWSAVTSGPDYTVALKKDGTLWAWGTTYQNTPTQIGTDTDWAVAAAGHDHLIALKTNGTLWARGANLYGQLGNGTTDGVFNPTQIGTDTDWTRAVAGQGHTVALKADGILWAWGRNDYGQVGDGTTDNKKYPTQISADTDWEMVTGANSHSVAVKTDGTLWAWGSNHLGQQLGDETIENRDTPTQIGIDSDWASIDTGGGIYRTVWFSFTIALKKDGTLWGWGTNISGQLGDEANESIKTPTQIETDTDWVAVSAGGYHTVALKSNGSLWAWGGNDQGQLGDGKRENISTPTQIGKDTDWTVMDAGYQNTVAIKMDGTLWAWGNNFGDDTNLPIRIGTDKDWAAVSAGNGFAVALKTDDTFWAWGNVLAVDGTLEYRPIPIQVGIDADWASVDAKWSNAVALKTDGTLWGWGGISVDQAGDGTNEDKSIPIQIGNDTDWTLAISGPWNTFALKINGTLWAWGNNGYGQIGDGTTEYRDTLVRVNPFALY